MECGGQPARRKISVINNHSELINQGVFHFSSPLDYSGIPWGWIHIGMSLEQLSKNVRANYIRLMLLAIGSICLGLLGSIFLCPKTEPARFSI